MPAAFDEDWLIQSSERISADGRELSTRTPQSSEWYRTSLPATVLGTLVEHGVYDDPFSGLNWKKLPGLGPAHENFSNYPMPKDSPFRVPWWFYKEFELNHEIGPSQRWLELEGLNYRANVWLNGSLIAGAEQIVGAYREHDVLLPEALLVNGTNRLAFEVFPPLPNDLGITWVDWNPSPPDKNMGLFRPAALRTTGPVALKHPQIRAQFASERCDFIELELFATLENATSVVQHGTICAEFEGGRFEAPFTLGARERRELAFSARESELFRLVRPRLWWPRHKGEQPLYGMNLTVHAGGRESDAGAVIFGVRNVSCELTDQGHSLFRVNGTPVLIRGGGWASDVFLRSNSERTLSEYEYVKDLNLNAIRFEGLLERRDFLGRCDRDGVLVIAGFCCCDHWEKWDNWKPEDLDVASESLRSQIRRARNHPSLIAWWYGSDLAPPRHVEERYLEVLDQERWPNPTHSSASEKSTELSGPSGLKMAGPYQYVPPTYWLTDTARGGAFGFATEISPGPAIPARESLTAMLTEQHLWPPDDCWTHHAGGGPFKDLTPFDGALRARYGAPDDLDDYVAKAQLMAYEAERAMFESFGRRKYLATGVIQWMLNNAWPSLIWHLWDWYLRPGGGYFGAKKACEPLHVQYSYDDRSVVVVNELRRTLSGFHVEARLLNLDSREVHRERSTIDIAADGVTVAFTIAKSAALDRTHFLRLTLSDTAGTPVSTNWYWLSTTEDRTDDALGNWYTTPQVAHADLSGLAALTGTELDVSCVSNGTELAITLTNSTPQLAFFVRLRLLSGEPPSEVLPVFWDDNFLSLLGHEQLTVRARLKSACRRKPPLTLELGGWNVGRQLLRVPERDVP